MCESHRQVSPIVGTSLPSVEAQPQITTAGKEVGGFRKAIGRLLSLTGNKIQGK